MTGCPSFRIMVPPRIAYRDTGGWSHGGTELRSSDIYLYVYVCRLRAKGDEQRKWRIWSTFIEID